MRKWSVDMTWNVRLIWEEMRCRRMSKGNEKNRKHVRGASSLWEQTEMIVMIVQPASITTRTEGIMNSMPLLISSEEYVTDKSGIRVYDSRVAPVLSVQNSPKWGNQRQVNSGKQLEIPKWLFKSSKWPVWTSTSQFCYDKQGGFPIQWLLGCEL